MSGDAAALRDVETAFNQQRYVATESKVFEALAAHPRTYLKPEFLLILSASYLRRGEPDQADVVLRSLTSLYPAYQTDENARILNALIYAGRGENEKAERALAGQASDRALLASALLLNRTNQSFAAVGRLKELMDRFPNSPLVPAAKTALALSYLDMDEPDHALAALADGKEPSHDLLRGVAEHRRGHMKEAHEFLNAAAAPEGDLEIAKSAVLLSGFYRLDEGEFAAAEKTLAWLDTAQGPISTAALVGLSQAYIRTNQLDKAVATCNGALSRVTGADRDRFLLIRGFVLQRQKKTSDAVADFEDVAVNGSGPWNRAAFILWGSALWAGDQYARLTTDYRKALEDYRKKVNAKAAEWEETDLVIAEANARMNRVREAEELYRRVLAGTPSPRVTAQAVSGLVAALVYQRKFEEAERQVDSLMVRFGEDRDVLRFGLLSQAHLFWNEGRPDLAAPRYARFVEMFPEDDRAPDAAFLWGRSLERAGDKAGAMGVWEELRAKHPASPASYRALVRSAAVAGEMGDAALAEKLNRDVARTDESDAAQAALVQVGLNELATNRPAAAIRTLDQFLGRFPQSNYAPRARDGLKQAYLVVALTDKPQLDSLAAKPTESPYAGEAYYQLGIQAYEKGDLEKAAGLFKRVWTDYPRTPSAPEALFYNAESDYRLNRYESALGLFGQFARNYPDHDFAGLARFHRSKSLLQAGFTDEALLAFKEVTEKSPHTAYAAAAYLDWGRALETKNDLPGALRAYELFLRDFPSNAMANAVTWRVSQIHRRLGNYATSLDYLGKVKPADGVASAADIDQMRADLQRVSADGGVR